MKNHILFFSLVIALCFACQSKKQQQSQSLLEKKDVQRIALIGGTLISSMENHGYFEKALLQHFPEGSVSLRNIGWPADDVYGLARAQFGSAQNTRSWKPPSAEEGFGAKVLMEHIEAAAPKTLIIGYGSEAATAINDAEFELFTSGYKRLLDFAEGKGIKLILVAPPKQEKVFGHPIDFRNDRLKKAADFIQTAAKERGHLFVNLYDELVTDPTKQTYTNNGVQLNQAGYERMSEILLDKIGIENTVYFDVELAEDATILNTIDCQTTDWVKTVNGVSFNLQPAKMLYKGKVHSENPVAIFINGELYSKNQDTISLINLKQDSLEDARLLATIQEKNRLHRYRLQPLNEAYIYLFRRHEMGHLAYEMDDLHELVAEKEQEINRLLASQTYDIEIELIKPWTSPKDYPEDEVPAFIPEPSIDQELAAFHLPDGYEINLFAADPMIANPINVNWDTKGRAWVATSSTYTHIVPGREPNDKIIILEDTDGDGKADKHTVFAENLLVPHSVMPVKGGAYVVATTQLLFFEDLDGDDVADTRRVVYDGFGNADVHHMIHGLRWTPWGNLHFTQSIYINSFVETAYGARTLNGSGTWVFRPEKEHLSIFSRGLVNPWGEAFDKWGQAFATDGAGGSGMNYIFPESAHATAVGAPKVLRGLNSGTPKNTAAEVVYSRHFPKDWQGTIITNDFRGNRTVRYKVTPDKSGYESKEVQTIIHSDHRSYRPVDTKIGPDGALYIVDWYNPIIDHGEVDFHHPIRDKTHGRIWRLTKKGSPLLKPVNTQVDNPTALLNLLKSPEQFTRLQANRAYVEQNGDPQAVVNWMKNIQGQSAAAYQYRLEGLWLLAALNHYDEATILGALNWQNPQARAAAVRQFANWKIAYNHRDKLPKLIEDKHPQVRLEAIHALRDMGTSEAVELAIKVLNHPMDENLTFALDLMLRLRKEDWLPKMVDNVVLFGGDVNKKMYALLTTEDARGVAPMQKLLTQSDLKPTLAKNAWQMLAKIGDASAKDQILQKAVAEADVSLLRTMANAPAAYTAQPNDLAPLATLLNHENSGLRREALKLIGRWKALDYREKVKENLIASEDMNEQLSAGRALVAMDEKATLIAVAKDDDKIENRVAANAIWIETDPEKATDNTIALLSNLESTNLAEVLFRTYRKMENGPAILEKALAGKSLPENIANAGLIIAQTSGLPLKDLETALKKAGNIQPVGMELSSADKAQLIKNAIAKGNRSRGRAIYRRPELMCGNCHKISFGGGLSGPNLATVGSYMTPNSILESILNPNTDIKQGYETVLITKTNGEIISGLLHRKTNNSTLIRQASGELIEIPSAEIAETDVSPVSLMPTGLTRNLNRAELTDLLAYMISLGK
ncbi:MAG: PVC-type heme-binding CxxCH protein [Saprospiraceae bacterium]